VHVTAYHKLTGQEVVRIPSVTAEGLLESGPTPLKILFFATEEKMPALLDDVRSLFEAQGLSPHLINGHFFGEIMKEGASKASALRQVMPHLGLTLSHVVSFGDGNFNNDSKFSHTISCS
jgi:hydroxymethylpyrimidine pyrophosphatase-like HAD family hydrolase